MKIIYPKLTPFLDLGFIRIGGPGLANSMIISAKAYILSKKNKFGFINPTWGKISFGPYFRRELDKRHYFGLFKKNGISGIKKIFYIIYSYINKNEIIKIDNMGDMIFKELKENYVITIKFFDSINKTSTSNIDYTNKIGIHIRLGDYKKNKLNTDISFYRNIIINIKKLYKDKYKFYIFSDGTNEELKELLSIDNVQRIYTGNALSDIYALSKCILIIGSDSTFSGLAAFIEQKPIIFPKKHFDSVLIDQNKELLLDKTDKVILKNFLINIL